MQAADPPKVKRFLFWAEIMTEILATFEPTAFHLQIQRQKDPLFSGNEDLASCHVYLGLAWLSSSMGWNGMEGACEYRKVGGFRSLTAATT